MKKNLFDVATNKGKVTVSGYIYKGLGYYKNRPGEYKITHIKSGKCLHTVKTSKEADRIIKIITLSMDCSIPEEEFKEKLLANRHILNSAILLSRA